MPNYPNRLKLDFSLQYRDERVTFLNTYLTESIFQQKPPTADELETMGNYLLWGKDRQTGLNAKQDGSVNLSSKHGDWDNDDHCESLDALMESPTFNEATLQPMNAPAPKTKREIFSRDEALANCPENMRADFVSLFREIDTLDLKINYYELLHNRRINPPREQLLRKFSADEQAEFQEAVTHWNQFKYLKQRHILVELRRQQYTLRDSFMPTMVTIGPTIVTEPAAPATFDDEIEVLPFGTWNKNTAARLLFRPFEELIPQNFGDDALEEISDFYWEKKQYAPGPNQKWIDFREPEHVYQIFQMFYDLDNDAASVEEDLLNGNTLSFMRALKFYIQEADLTELQRDILDMKLNKKKNTDIAFDVNHKWKKSYTPNYISTIFRQRIVPKINDAARYHELIVSNLFFPEEFKTCTGCGRTLLRDPINFTRKTRSKDGYTTRCKRCEKAARNKETINNEE